MCERLLSEKDSIYSLTMQTPLDWIPPKTSTISLWALPLMISIIYIYFSRQERKLEREVEAFLLRHPRLRALISSITILSAERDHHNAVQWTEARECKTSEAVTQTGGKHR